MPKIIGRKQEQGKLARLLESSEPEFIAVYGRRRVGKTFLISEFFKDKGLYFEATGQYDVGISGQLDNFTKSLEEKFFQVC